MGFLSIITALLLKPSSFHQVLKWNPLKTRHNSGNSLFCHILHFLWSSCCLPAFGRGIILQCNWTNPLVCLCSRALENVTIMTRNECRRLGIVISPNAAIIISLFFWNGKCLRWQLRCKCARNKWTRYLEQIALVSKEKQTLCKRGAVRPLHFKKLIWLLACQFNMNRE